MSAIVIGAGLAGLAVAAGLAQAGQDVTVLERRQNAGGRGETLDVAGARLNLGPHALYPHAAEVLRGLGVAVDGARPPSGVYALADGAVQRLPDGLWSALTTPMLSLGQAAELIALLRRPPAPGASVEQHLQGLSPHAADMMRMLIRLSTYTHATDLQRADRAFTQLKLGARVIYPHGGWGALVEGLVGRARAAGAQIRLGTDVRALAPGEVRLASGEVLTADHVVVALPRAAAARLIPDEAAPPPPVQSAILDLVLERLPRPERNVVLGLRQASYYSVHSAAARLGDGVVVHVARYLAPDEHAPREALEADMDLIQPGWRAHLRHARYLPAVLTASSLDAVGHERPGISAGPGLWRCGDYVGEQGLLADASLLSARAVIDAVRSDVLAQAA